MKIAVLGSGGVGARLAMGGAEAHFVACGAHLQTMRKKGIAVEGGPEPIHVASVNATGDPAEIGIADLVLVIRRSHRSPFAVPLWHAVACATGSASR